MNCVLFIQYITVILTKFFDIFFKAPLRSSISQDNLPYIALFCFFIRLKNTELLYRNNMKNY